MKHWIVGLTDVFGSNANIELNINNMRDVTLAVRGVGTEAEGQVYKLERRFSWEEFENPVPDPLDYAAASIIAEWMELDANEPKRT